MRRVVTHDDWNAQASQVASRVAVCITSCHHRAAANEELGKSTHPGAGNPYKVDGSAVCGIDERHEKARRI